MAPARHASPSLAGAGRLVLPAPDLAPLLAEARERDARKLPFRFATPLPVAKPARELAPWTIADGLARWELAIVAAGAQSLNLAFDRFHLPPGATLVLQSPGQAGAVTFTSRDNDDHGELWTPLFPGEEVRLTASLPAALLPQLQLHLAAVNYGFRKMAPGKMGGDLSGACNIDVACGVEDLPFGSLIEAYRRQIRAVGAYTVSGIDTCSGALINNTAQDGKPYFLTAEHCDITASNDASVVVYWNFENSSCRTPGSAASGGVGDGDLSVFNSGSILRAEFAGSDFCLIELDDPVNPASGAYLAGWSRESSPPTEGVAIHHPAVAEKRISFEFDPLTLTDYGSAAPSSFGYFLRVADWDEGTTEGGSSGSPLFNESGLIVGQLFGGNASCGNNASDWYGFLSRSWSGGGTASRRLSDWLSPGGSAPLTLAGRELRAQLEVSDRALTEGDSGTTSAAVTVTLAQAVSFPVSFSLVVAGGTAEAGSDYSDPGRQEVTFAPGQTSFTFSLPLLGDSEPEEHETILFAFEDLVEVNEPDGPLTVIILNDDFIPPAIASGQVATGHEGTALRYEPEVSHTPNSFSLSGQPVGMTIDEFTGVITWEEPLFGDYVVTLTAGNEAGEASEALTFAIGDILEKEAFEVPREIVMGGEVSRWQWQEDDTFDGEDALRLNGVADGETVTLSLAIPGPDTLTYWWKASSEYLLDRLVLTCNGEEAGAISGETGWHPITVELPEASNTVLISYQRNSQYDGGADTVWLDSFSLHSQREPVFRQPHRHYLPNGGEFAFALETLRAGSRFSAKDLPPGWTLSPQGLLQGQMGGEPVAVSLTATREGAERTRVFTWEPYYPKGTLSRALDLPELSIRSEVPSFYPQTSTTVEGTSAARSGGVDADEGTAMTATVVGPGSLSFQWRVATEDTFDVGYVWQNGRQIAAKSGVQPWETVSLTLEPGLNEITWYYLKDETNDDNADAIYIDDLRLEGYAAWVFAQARSPFTTPPGDDSDGDGLGALLEYALGLSPAERDLPAPLSFSPAADGWLLSASPSMEASGLTLFWEKTTNLEAGSWETVGEVALPASGPFEVTADSGEPQAFFRLRAAAP
ncbi:Calx-beta domain-containing protein [Roseibacillus ishigakijimensis]|uniref:Trypsin-like peptidase domain-containing protein n=1 Tax=Roseibacillus ishigakijimensis TaxID=454146 RepID=A0A934VGB3_9BACT|nr:Calx-beta domain-containing protein [Roseibacillus ishigakijimensis]MBK1832668.1 trypsin-like peptidase domain-containing protein [Roseibacillus ishigakijimensis]